MKNDALVKLGCLAFILAGSATACSGADEPPAGAGWSCRPIAVPLGRTLECTSRVASGLGTSDGVSPTSGSTLDGPAYVCPLAGESSPDCPPASAYRDLWTFTPPAAGGSTSDGVGTPGTATGSAPAPGGGGAGGTGDYNPDEAPSGGGGASAPQPGSGTGGGAGSASGGAGTRDGVSDGFFCTKEGGLRSCRVAPLCDPGAHRVQMDCEPDQSSGLGAGAGAPASGGFPGGGTSDGWTGGGSTECFYPVGSPPGSAPAATFQYVLEAIQGVQSLHTRLTFSPSFVDNSYGTTAVGWPKGHKFQELVGSDHAELAFLDKAGAVKLHFKMDYISQSATAPSGWASLGVRGGEGKMIVGSAASVLKAVTSLDRNLNERGYASFVVSSPATTATYAPPPSAPAWDYRVIYEAWIDNAAFGSGGFDKVRLSFVHASPSKAGSNSLPVTPGPCPPGW